MMERNNRAVWVFVGIAAVLLLCCCIAAAAASLGGWFASRNWGGDLSLGQAQERLEESYPAGTEPYLKIDNFAGAITVRPGQEGEIRVVAIKKGTSRQQAQNIQMERNPGDNGLEIKTRKPSSLSNASVQFDITAPPGTRLELATGAGNIDVRGFASQAKIHTGAGSITMADAQGLVDLDTGAGSINITNVQGEIKAHTGAGSIDARDSSGPARLDTGAGSIDYRGEPLGDCRFETGTGSITLRLPAGLNAEVDLETGMGTINVQFDVAGSVTKRDVQGTIGRGGDAVIRAHTGTGSIDVIRY
jgi:hypothetical protein